MLNLQLFTYDELFFSKPYVKRIKLCNICSTDTLININVLC